MKRHVPIYNSEAVPEVRKAVYALCAPADRAYPLLCFDRDYKFVGTLPRSARLALRFYQAWASETYVPTNVPSWVPPQAYWRTHFLDVGRSREARLAGCTEGSVLVDVTLGSRVREMANDFIAALAMR